METNMLQPWQQTQIYDALIEKIQFERELSIISSLNIPIQIDGNQWVYLYGKDLQSGIAGFGNTPYEAVLNFNKNFLTQKL